MSGSVTPTTGKMPATMPMLKKTCQKSSAAQRLGEAIARLGREVQRPQDQEQVAADQDGAADEAPLLGEHRERKVGPVLGQKLQLVLRAVQPALAGPAPAADGEDGLP